MKIYDAKMTNYSQIDKVNTHSTGTLQLYVKCRFIFNDNFLSLIDNFLSLIDNQLLTNDNWRAIIQSRS